MDPNANLKEQLEIAALLDVESDRGEIARLADRLAELVQVMNAWLVAGGFLPDAWSRP